jgi:hypothetical protein
MFYTQMKLVILTFLSLIFGSWFETTSYADIVPIYSNSRANLTRLNSKQLKIKIQNLLEGDHVTLRNIGAILQSGQKLLNQRLEQEAEYRDEIITLYKTKDIHSPYRFIFDEPREISVLFTEDWAKYTHTDQMLELLSQGYSITFTDFANTELGGGWDAGGNVQEEQMIQQCPDFPLILSGSPTHDSEYYTRKYSGSIPKDDFEAHLALRGPSDDSADPILLTNLRCLQEIKDEYSKDWMRIRKEPYSDLAEVLIPVPNSLPINVIAMAAPEVFFDFRGKSYTISLLNDLFNNAYTAFSMVQSHDKASTKKTHLVTGRWGAGAFGHNVSMVIAIQYLAARLAGVNQLKFTGISQQEGQPVIQFVDHLIKTTMEDSHGKISTEILLRNLLINDFTASWKTRPL